MNMINDDLWCKSIFWWAMNVKLSLHFCSFALIISIIDLMKSIHLFLTFDWSSKWLLIYDWRQGWWYHCSRCSVTVHQIKQMLGGKFEILSVLMMKMGWWAPHLITKSWAPKILIFYRSKNLRWQLNLQRHSRI